MIKIGKYKEVLHHLHKDFNDMCDSLHKKGSRYTSNDILLFGALGASIEALEEMDEDCEEDYGEKSKEKSKEKAEEIRDNIKEELMSAEHYYKKFLETNDPNYKQMSKEELKHADFFIKQARMSATDTESQKKIQTYINWYTEITDRID